MAALQISPLQQGHGRGEPELVMAYRRAFSEGPHNNVRMNHNNKESGKIGSWRLPRHILAICNKKKLKIHSEDSIWFPENISNKKMGKIIMGNLIKLA